MTAPFSVAAAEVFLCVTNPGTGWVVSLRRAGDSNHLEFLRSGQALGPVILRVRIPGSPWHEVRQSTNGVDLWSSFRPQDDALLWEIGVKKIGNQPLEIGDLALPLPVNTDYVWDHEAPGMVVPRDLTARLALRNTQKLESIEPEFPARATVEDQWADPRGEYLGAFQASAVYRLLGKKGLETEASPPVGAAVIKSDVGYHIRQGGHSVETFDWLRFLDFAEYHLKQ